MNRSVSVPKNIRCSSGGLYIEPLASKKYTRSKKVSSIAGECMPYRLFDSVG